MPNAESGSAASARSYASSIVAATATPHGFACLTITHGRQRELAQQQRARPEVGEVVERELPAAELLDVREQVPARADLAVVGGALVRVLAVREVLHLLERERQRLRERPRVSPNQRAIAASYAAVVANASAASARRVVERQRAVLAELVEHGVVLLGLQTARRARSSSPRRAASTGRRRRSSRRRPPARAVPAATELNG